MPTNNTPTIDIAALGREYLAIKVAKVAAEKRMKEIEQTFRDGYDFGNEVAGPAKVSIQHNVSRDDKLVVETFPPAEFPHLYKPAVDGDALKANLTGAQYASLQKEGPAKVIITAFE
jgi:hypothetical protein